MGYVSSKTNRKEKTGPYIGLRQPCFCSANSSNSNTNVTDVVAPWGGYTKFTGVGLNEDYLPLWLQAGGINTYYVGKFSNGHSITTYLDPPVAGWTKGQ